MSDKIYQILVPEETVETTDKNGKKKQKVSKMYSGYVFVEMEVDEQKGMDEAAWFNVRNTPKVTGFLGSSGGGTKPVPVPKAEMDDILQKLGMIQKPKFEIVVGDKVNITSGAFAGQVAEVVSIDEKSETLSVLVEMFGRPTPMELGFNEVKKI